MAAALQLGGKDIIKMANNYERDKKLGMDLLGKIGDVSIIHFENIIMFPKSTATMLGGILDYDLDIKAMENVVQFRPTQCGLDMNLEFRLLNEKG
jgi:hypothetical protein